MPAAMLVRLCLGLALATAVARAGEAQWSGSDYLNSYFRHYNGHVPLPHLRDAVQKALFKHLVDPANITHIEAAPVSDDEKLRQLRIILAVLGSYRAAYNVAVIVGEPLVEELAEVQVFSLEVTAAAAKLLPGDDGASSAWTTLVEGVIDEIGNTQRYSPEQRVILADAIAKHYPVIAKVLPGGDRLRLDESVMQMRNALLAAP